MMRLWYIAVTVCLLAVSIALYVQYDKKANELHNQTERVGHVFSKMIIYKHHQLEELSEKMEAPKELKTELEHQLYNDQLSILVNNIDWNDSHLEEGLRILYSDDMIAFETFVEQAHNVTNALLLLIEENDEAKLKLAATIIKNYNSQQFEILQEVNPLDRYKIDTIKKLTTVYHDWASELEKLIKTQEAT